MERRCMNCMKLFPIPKGMEGQDNVCMYCGYVEHTKPETLSYLIPGTKLNNRYTVGVVLGAGGFGITYKAWDETFESIVAVKEYFPSGMVSRTEGVTVSISACKNTKSFEHGKVKFLKEARNLAKFNHNSGVVSVSDFFEENGTAYIVMEYLKVCNLKQYILSHETPLPLDMIYKMSEKIFKTLADIHSAGLVHMDISPDNIFLCDDGNYKLIDFGAIKQALGNQELSTTVVLKHGFAPIEQYTKQGNIGPWTDIYALGATLYKMSTGIVPPEAVDRIYEDGIEDPLRLNHSLPKHFATAVMKALAVKPDKRFLNVMDFWAALNNESEIDTDEKKADRSTSKVSDLDILGQLGVRVVVQELKVPTVDLDDILDMGDSINNSQINEKK